METHILLAVLAVLIVVAFDFTNGFHDAANIVATLIASRAMQPMQAVILVGVFEFLGPLLGGTAVANTIGSFIKLSDLPREISLTVLVSGLAGAICWNLITWRKGIPSSSSHALVGGLIGSILLAVDASHVVWGFQELFSHGHLTGVTKVLLALVLSPIIGFWVGFGVHKFFSLVFRTATPRLNQRLRWGQYATAAGLAFSHGANDAQKSMGILTLILVLGGFIPVFEVPFWVVMTCATALTMGIMSGGWRIVRTLGFAIYKVRPLHALNSQLTSAAVIFSASLVGAPVSTTHVVATSIMGIGASERPRAVRWSKAGEIAMTWIVTIPAAAFMGAAILALVQAFIRRGQL